jgi:hypothetical protein
MLGLHNPLFCASGTDLIRTGDDLGELALLLILTLHDGFNDGRVV